jgi:hypothetical protein
MANIDKHEAGTVSWFDLMSNDKPAATAFYRELFGWELEQMGGAQGYTMCKIGGRAAAGIDAMPPGTPYSAWTAYFAVDDADAAAKTIAANGGKVMVGPTAAGESGRYTIAQDPSGAVFGTWEPKHHKGAGVRDQHGAMTWQECHTRDAAAARDFYARTFKLEPVKMPGGQMEYWTLDRGAAKIGGVFHDTHMPAEVPPHWLVYFQVDHCDASCAKATAAGGKVIQPGFDTPFGRMAVIKDPTGAVFAINQAPAAKK